MNFIQYLNHLLEIGIEYNKYMKGEDYIFADCIGGNIIPVIRDLQKLIEKPVKEFDQRDWQSIRWVLSRVKKHFVS